MTAALHRNDIPREVLDVLHRGAVIPAHPLALDASRKLDVARQRALSRYYLDAGAGGLAVGGLVTAGAEERIALYTGNDDHIVLFPLTPFEIARGHERVWVQFRGGLLGHWSVWVRTAVDLFARFRKAQSASCVDRALLELDSRVTDCNAAFFDVATDFRGCIAGCHEVLRRQGLLEGIWCLDPRESLSPGQREEIDRVYREHADLADDAFVRQNLARWLE